MPRRKRPRKPGDSSHEAEVVRETQPKSELIPPARRPPTAVGAETPTPPPERAREPRRRPALWHLLQSMRAVVGALLDLADGAAEAITKELERRA
ncbi:MAG TPA: hypothetical protein VGJ80_12760 [Gemmatimonadales bacterium]|jgi:hypothetical protein